MRDDEQPIRLAGIQRHARGRALHRELSPAEDEQVEVELARAPALALLATEGALELLESHQQCSRARGRIGSGGHIE